MPRINLKTICSSELRAVVKISALQNFYLQIFGGIKKYLKISPQKPRNKECVFEIKTDPLISPLKQCEAGKNAEKSNNFLKNRIKVMRSQIKRRGAGIFLENWNETLRSRNFSRGIEKNAEEPEFFSKNRIILWKTRFFSENYDFSAKTQLLPVKEWSFTEIGNVEALCEHLKKIKITAKE
jgi:hypothetical protein